MCVCASIQRVPNRTRVQLIVHPKERRHPLGTLRFLELGLGNIRIDSDFAPKAPPDLQDAAIDGTWSQAKNLFRDNPWLQALPRCALPEAGESRYRVRKEPVAGYVSTLEAVLAVLGVLEPEHGAGFEGLLDAFDAMQDAQLAQAAGTPRPRMHKKKRPPRPIPDLLRHTPERLVLVHGRMQGTGDNCGPVTLGAVRLVGDDCMFGAVKARIEEAGSIREAKMDLSDAQRAAAGTSEELQARLQSFLRPDDVVCGWTAKALRHMQMGPGLALKATYCDFRKKPCGPIDALLANEGLEPGPPPFHGETGLALAWMKCVAQFLASQPQD
jgi:DTW domain-containing protein YfiP